MRVRTWLQSRWLTLVVGVCAAGPVIASTLRALVHGWLPAGDQAIIATRAYDVLTSRTPLVGQHSDASALIHHVVYSLGPMLFWVLAVPVRVAGPWSLPVTMGLLNSAAIVGSVVLARRRGGRTMMFATALAIVVMSRSLAPEVLHDVWNPSAGLFPFTLLIFLCWSIACGEYRLLPLAVLVASFVVQCQLTYLAPTVLLAVVALAGLLVSLRAGRARPRPPGRGPRVRRFALAAAARRRGVLGAAGHRPARGQPGEHHRGREGRARDAPRHGGSDGGMAGGRARRGDPPVVDHRSRPLRGSARWKCASSPTRSRPSRRCSLLCALAGLALLGLLRRRVDVWAGALMCLALCAALAAVAASTPNTRLAAATLGYTLWWGSPAGMFVWLFTAFAAVSLWARRPLLRGRSPRLVAAVGIAAVAICALAVAAGQRADEHLQEYRPLKTMFTALDRRVPAGRTVLLHGRARRRNVPLQNGGALRASAPRHPPALARHRQRLGSWYELDHRRYDCAVYVKDGRAQPRSARGSSRELRLRGRAPAERVDVPGRLPHRGRGRGARGDVPGNVGELRAAARAGALRAADPRDHQPRAGATPRSSSATSTSGTPTTRAARSPPCSGSCASATCACCSSRAAPRRERRSPRRCTTGLRYVLAAALVAAAAIAGAALLLRRRRRRKGGDRGLSGWTALTAGAGDDASLLSKPTSRPSAASEGERAGADPQPMRAGRRARTRPGAARAGGSPDARVPARTRCGRSRPA